MSGDHNQYQKPDYVDRRQWKYDPVTGEPVAKYSDIVSDGGLDPRRKFDVAPQRKWVGLTDDEIKEIVGPWGGEPIKGYTRELIDKIEEALRRKNG